MTADNYQDLAKDIIKNIGGESNVKDLRHCITRLRFNLKDNSLANDDAIKKLNGVVTVVKSGGQYQVVIGQHVAEVYQAILNQTSISGQAAAQDEEVIEDDRNFLNKFIDFISGVFQPFLMALSATGMIKGVVALLGSFGLNADNSGLYFVLNMAGDAFFQFLPVMVAITTARKLKMNEFTAIAIAVAFLHPSLGTINNREVLYTLFAGTPFESNVQLSMLGLPVILPRSGYYASIIPIIASVWFGSKLEKWFSQRLPKILRSFLTPFFTVLIAFPIALLIIGPIANFLSAIIGEFFVGIYDISPILFGTLLAAIWQILVIFGLHWGIIPIQFLLLAEQGFEPVSATTMMSTFGILGVLLALIIKSKEDKVKQIAIPASFSALFGISEPAVYGLMLPLRRSFIYAIIANAIAGAYIGYTNTVSYRTGGLGIFSMFRGNDPDGTLGANFLIGFAIATLVAFVLQMLFPVERLDKATEAVADDVIVNDTNDVTPVPVVAEDEEIREEIIASPLSGELMPLSETPDAVFSSGALGKGITIKPSEGLVKAPANGKVTALFDTGHAIGITTDLGTEILIHIGIDTVEMNGQGFTKLVENGDTVQAGQDLIQFDIATIEAAGKSSVVPVIVTKSGDYTDVIFTTDDIIKVGDYLFTSVK